MGRWRPGCGLPFALVMAVFSPVAMALSHRFGPRPVAITGALLMSAGFAVVEVAHRRRATGASSSGRCR